jgi:hypothetical protein
MLKFFTGLRLRQEILHGRTLKMGEYPAPQGASGQNSR